ncbi:MAG: biotin transporter BioY [Clostridiaceae bacterium]
MNNKLSVRDISFIGMGAALMAVLSQISIPVPFSAVPLTLSVTGVMLLSLILKPKQSFLSVLIFILLGSAGVPVFANFRGGFNVILGPTGGYLIGYLLMTLVIGYAAKKDNTVAIVTSVYAALALDYLLGVSQLAFVAHLSLNKALIAGFYPFIIKDIVLSFIVCMLGIKIKKRMSVIIN